MAKKNYEITFTDFNDGEPGETTVSIEETSITRLCKEAGELLEAQSREIFELRKRLSVPTVPCSACSKPMLDRGADKQWCSRACAEKPGEMAPVQAPQMGDSVNHPHHYNGGKIECIEYLEDQFMDRPHEWNAVKYLTRAKHKGKEVEDLEKAIWYIRRKLVLLKGTGFRPNDMPQTRV